MTTAEIVKTAGLRSVKQMSEMTGYTAFHLRSLRKNQPARFEILLLGCAAKLLIERYRDVHQAVAAQTSD